MPRWIILVRSKGGDWQTGPTGATLHEAQGKLRTMIGLNEMLPCRLHYDAEYGVEKFTETT